MSNISWPKNKFHDFPMTSKIKTHCHQVSERSDRSTKEWLVGKINYDVIPVKATRGNWLTVMNIVNVPIVPTLVAMALDKLKFGESKYLWKLIIMAACWMKRRKPEKFIIH